MRFHRDILQTSSLVVLLSFTSLSGPAIGQAVTGELGAPGATTTIDGNQLPASPPKFDGVIKETLEGSKTWWPPRVVPLKGAPRVGLRRARRLERQALRMGG